jgi:hypothetical protein
VDPSEPSLDIGAAGHVPRRGMAGAQQVPLVGSVAARDRARRHHEMGDRQHVLFDEPVLEVLFAMPPPAVVVPVAESFGGEADGCRTRRDPARPLEEHRAVEWGAEHLGPELGTDNLHEALQQCRRDTVLGQ